MKNIYNDHSDCQNPNCYTCYGSYTVDDIRKLPYKHFDTTRCVVLMACYAGLGGESNPNNMVNTLHNKGVWTVVGFRDKIYYYSIDYDPDVHTDDVVNIECGAQLWITVFTQLLGEGYTVNNAISGAYDTTILANLKANNYTKYEFDNNFIPEPIKTECILCGLDKWYVAGDKNQIVKH